MAHRRAQGPIRGFGSGLARSLEKGSGVRGRAFLFLTSIALLFVLFAIEIVPSVSEFMGDHPILFSVITSVLVLAAGGAGFFLDSAERMRVLDQSVTSAGLAAVVDQLSDVDTALSMWMVDPELLGSYRDQHRSAHPGSRPMRWTRQIRGWKRPESGMPPEVVAADRLDLLADVADEGVRHLMAALRGWADLLSRSEVGIESMDALNDLRLGLMSIQDAARRGDETDLLQLLQATRDRARLLSLLFELSSDHSPDAIGVEVPTTRTHLNWDLPASSSTTLWCADKWPKKDNVSPGERSRRDIVEFHRGDIHPAQWRHTLSHVKAAQVSRGSGN